MVRAFGYVRIVAIMLWSFRLVADRTSDGRPIRMLTIVDEFTRECLAIDVAKRLTSEDVLERLSDLFVTKVCRITSAVTLARVLGQERP